MEFKFIFYSIFFMGLMFFNTPISAQESGYNLITKELTVSQQELLRKEKEVMKTDRANFKTTLSKEQLSILRNKTISKSEIKQKLVSTFSRTQKDLIRDQQVRLRKTRDDFRKTLTGDQRKMLKDRIDKIRKTKDRGELKEGPRNNSKDKKRSVRGN